MSVTSTPAPAHDPAHDEGSGGSHTEPSTNAGALALRRPLERFDRVERLVHWSTAIIMLELLATGAILRLPSLMLEVGHRSILEAIHVWTGVGLLAPLFIGIALPWRAKLVSDLRRFDTWSRSDWDWFHRKAKRTGEPVGKFNGGQKLEAALLGAGMVVMLVTGVIMRFGPASWIVWARGATFVHDVGFLCIGLAVLAHIYVALSKPEQLKSMVTGRISRAWASQHAPVWLDEVEEEVDKPA